MKKIPLIVLGIALLFVVFGYSRYNGLVDAQENVEKAWSQVENVLQRRADLIPNLVNTVKGYAAHEKTVFTDVANARAKLAGASSRAEKAAANAGVSSALGRLLAISERYPDLKANTNFAQLQDELAGTENRIATERRRFNDAAASYNKSVRKFPSNVFAGIFNFEQTEYFEAQKGATAVPSVDFGK